MIASKTLVELASMLRTGALSSVELTRGALETAAREKSLGAFIVLHRKTALEQALCADRVRQSGSNLGPLHGIPIALKDNIDEGGVPCSAGSAAYRDRVPERDAIVVNRLKEAGAVILGRTNMHELADGVTSENPHYGQVHNPHRRGFHPGGSSGGSAVAVATGCVPAALGTDTGGSVRIPAALCGVVGMKPTSGLVPTAGIVPLSTTLDAVGPIARTVPDLATILSVLANDRAGDFLAACNRQPGTIRLGLLHGFGLEADPEVREVFEAALGILEQIGCELHPVDIPALQRSLKLLANIYAPEAARYHADRLRERPGDFGEQVRADLERGSSISLEAYDRALEERLGLESEVARRTQHVDLLACPTTPHPARPIGSPAPHTYLLFTSPFNLTGQPAVSVPMGHVDGLPVGLQLVGRKGDDADLLTLAAAFERELNSRGGTEKKDQK